MEGKKEKQILLCKTNPIIPVLCACNQLGFTKEVSGKSGRWEVLSGLGIVGEGIKVRRMGLSKGVLTALNRTAAEQENNIRRRTSMQLEERPTFLCAMTNREVVCQCSFFPITTVRCVASVCSAKQQVQIASKEGAPPKKDFSNTKQGGA